jgi:hypothetical protein
MRALIRKEYLRWFLFFMTLLLLSEQLGLYYSILNRIAGLFCLIMYCFRYNKNRAERNLKIPA